MRFTVEVQGGADLEFECGDTITSRWVCEAILTDRTYPDLPFVDDVRVVFDAGANCGAMSVHFARRHPDARVHAFEPGSEALAILERNAAAYPNIDVHAFGLGAQDEIVPLYRGDGDTILGSVHRRAVNRDDSEDIQLRHAGAWAAAHGIDRVDVLKIDVEGCEVDVLQSLVGLLPTVQVLYVEYDSRRARRDLDAILEPTHVLFTARAFLDQGECVYLREDVSARPGARAYAPAGDEDRPTPDERSPFATRTDDGSRIDFECGAARSSRCRCRAILEGRTHPHLPFLGDAATVLDVGAGCGATAVHLARLHPQAAVHAFEPDRERRTALEHNVAAYPGVRTHPQRDAGRWASEHGIEAVDVVKVHAGGREDEVLADLAALLPAAGVVYVEHSGPDGWRAVDRVLGRTHELYAGMLLPDQGSSTYLRRDLADVDGARAHLVEILRLQAGGP